MTGRLLTVSLLLTFSVFAEANPNGINISGKLSLQADNSAMTAPDVDFRIRVLSPDGCMLYAEKFVNQNLQLTSGIFNLTIGNGDVTYNAWGGTYGTSGTAKSKENLLKVFSNSSATVPGLTAYPGETCAGGTYAPADGDIRRVVIEFDPTGADNVASYVALSPYHTIRSVPYAMLADQSTNAENLGGTPAAQYVKTSDLATAVPNEETDPNVEAFAKTPITNLVGGQCDAGYVLTFNGTQLTCVADGGGGGSYTLPIASDTVLGGVRVQSGSGLSINAGNGDLAIDTTVMNSINGKVNASAIEVCPANQVPVWVSIVDAFDCMDIAITASQITDFNTAVDARVGNGSFLKLDGTSTMAGNINLNGNDLQNTDYIHMTTQNPGAAPAAGYVWFNSTAKQLRISDGTDVRNIPNYIGTCADGELLKWDNGAGNWICATDAGSGGGANATQIQGVDVSAVAPTAGQFLKLVGGDWTATSMPTCTAAQTLIFDGAGVATCTAISGLADSAIAANAAIARSKLALGTADHVLINDNTGAMSSEAQLAITRGGTGVGTAPNADQILVGNATNEYELKTLTAGTGITLDTTGGAVTITATATAPGVASYAATGVVRFLTDAATSGIVVDGSGIANVNTGTAGGGGDANKIPKLDGSGLLAPNMIPGLAWSKITSGTPTDLAGYGITDAVRNVAGTPSFETGNTIGRPAASVGTTGRIYIDSQTNTIYRDTGAAWVAIGDGSGTVNSVTSTNGDITVGGTAADPDLAINSGTNAGQFLKFGTNGTLPALNASALTNIDVAAITSDTGKYLTYLPNGIACADDGVLKWDDSNGRWICGTDAGAGGGVDAVSLQGRALNAAAPVQGEFLQYTGASWSRFAMPQCTATQVLTFSLTGVATCENIAGLTNSAIAANAAIARTKIATGTANRLVINADTTGELSEAALINPNVALISNANGIPTHSAVTATELGYLTGATSNIQAQITSLSTGAGDKVNKAGDTMSGNLVMDDESEVRFVGTTDANHIGFKAPATVTNSVVYTLPANDGTANQLLQTDGNGALTWATPPSGADNLGNHTATQNITLGSNWISNDGSNKGLRVDAAGNVGINTAPSVAMLHINANGGSGPTLAAGDDLVIQRNNGSGDWTRALLIGGNSGGSSLYFGSTSNRDRGAITYDNTSHSMRLSTNFGERVRIDSAGRVGIGTETPGALLDVKGAIRMSGSTSGYTGFQPAAAAGSTVWTLPTADGTGGQALTTNGSGILQWTTLPAGAVDSDYNTKGIVGFDTDVATSGMVYSSAGIAKVNTGTNAGQILQFATNGTLPALNGSALTNLDVAAITSANGKYFKYMPNGVECGDGEILKWVAADDNWVCGTVGGVTSVAAGTGVDVNTAAGVATVSVEAELAALNGLSTDGYLFRNGAATYGTTTGNVANSNSTVVLRDGSGVSAFSGVTVSNGTGNVTQTAPVAGSSYTVTWPAVVPGADGYILSSTTGGIMSWIPAPSGADNLGNHTATQNIQLGSFWLSGDGNNEGVFVAADGKVGVGTATPNTALSVSGVVNADNYISGYGNATTPAYGIAGDGTGLFSPVQYVLGFSTDDTERMRISPTGQVGIGTTNPTKLLDVQGTGDTTASFRRSDNDNTRATIMQFRRSRADATAPNAGFGSSMSFRAEGFTNNSETNQATIGAIWEKNQTNDTTDRDAALVFQTTLADTLDERMRITSTGRVGIGTAAPVTLLDVDGGLKIGTSAEGCSLGMEGALQYTGGAVQFCNGTTWTSFGTGSGSGTVTSVTSANADIDVATGTVTPVLTLNSGTGNNQIVKRDANGHITTGAQKEMRFMDNGGTNYVSLRAPTSVTNYTLTYPAAAPSTNGQVLSTTTAGVKTWVTPLTSADSSTITDGSIMNIDINASAAIDRTKLASGSFNHVLINNGSGVMSSEAQLAVSRGGTGSASFTANGLVMAGATTTSPLISLTCAALGRTLEWTGSAWGCSSDFLTSGNPGSKVNYVLLTGSNTGVAASIAASGTDANVTLSVLGKGTGQVQTDSVLNVAKAYMERAPAATSTSATLPTDANIYRHTMSGNTTLTLPACPATSGTAFSMTVRVRQHSTASTLTWAGATIEWDSNTEPAMTTTVNKDAIYQFLCFQGDSTWYGMQVWKFQ